MNSPLVGDVRGQGLMMAVDLVADKQTKAALPASAKAGNRVFQKCIEKGVIVRPVGDRIVLSPPLIIDRAQVDTVISAISEALSEVQGEI